VLKGDSRTYRLFRHLYRGRGIDIIFALAKRQGKIGFHLIGGEAVDVRDMEKIRRWLSNMFFLWHVEHAAVLRLLGDGHFAAPISLR